MGLAHALAGVPSRFGFAFTPDGRRVARVADRGGDMAVEETDLAGGSPPRRVYGGELFSAETQLCFPSADRIWIRSGAPGSFRLVEGRRQVPGEGWQSRLLLESDAVALWMLPDRNHRANDIVVTSAEEGSSTVWRLHPEGAGLEPLARLPGFVNGAAWLEAPHALAVSLFGHDRPSSGFLIDLEARSYHRLFHVSDHSNDAIASCKAPSGTLWVTSDCFGYRRAGVADVRGGRKVRFFDELPGAERSVDPLGRSGRQVVLRRRRGVCNELWLADPDTLGVSGPLALPRGVVSSAVADAGDRLRFGFTAPALPAACAAYLRASGRFEIEEAPELGPAEGMELSVPDLASIPTRNGPVEALIYLPTGRAAGSGNVIVVALHGGPVAQWSAEFSPDLQLLAGLGAVVAAPNYHGSTGYGEGFVEALRSAGGSLDVEDVVAVVHALRTRASPRVPVVLYGSSYGAFLALATASTHPDLCQGVVAVAPFSSLGALRGAGVPSVQRVVDLVDAAGGSGAPDLLGRCGELRAKVLIVHGDRDRIVPIAESRALAAALRAHGYVDGRNLWFLALPEGHTISDRTSVLRLYEQMESFLTVIDGSSMSNGTDGQDVAGRRPRIEAQERLGAPATP